MHQSTQKNPFNVMYQEQSSHSALEDDDQEPLPTYKEFQEIINDYLGNLSPKKRDKALVDHTRYCLIQDVLRHPRNTSISTAQFRFWVKKMFRLQPGSYDLVFHDNKPVAMKEQIYDILVNAHKEAHHGGRDKTSAIVRNQFSWIPKELVARFVRQCPTCISRRNGIQSLNTMPYSPKNSSPQQQLDYPVNMNYLYEMTSRPFLSQNNNINNSNSNSNSNSNNNNTGIAAPNIGTPPILLYTPSSSSSVGTTVPTSVPVGNGRGNVSIFPFTENKHKKETSPNYITASNVSPSAPKRPFFGSNGLFESCEQYSNNEEEVDPEEQEENSQKNSFPFQMISNNSNIPHDYQIQQPHPSIRSPATFDRRKEFLNYSTFTTNVAPSYYNAIVVNPCNNDIAKNDSFNNNMFHKKGQELSLTSTTSTTETAAAAAVISASAAAAVANTNRTNILYHNQEHSL